MKRHIVPVVLFLFGLVLFMKHINFVSGISLLNSNHTSETLTSAVIDLDNKTIISGEFLSDHQNLAKISFNLYIPNEFKRGKLSFRLKKSGQDKWYYEHQFFVENLAKNEKVSFSFPPIKDSRENNYKFEIEYFGDYASGRIAIRNSDYVFTSSHDYFYGYRINPTHIYAFTKEKILEIGKIPGIYLYFFLSFFPFFVSLFSIVKLWPGFLTILALAFVLTDLTTAYLDIDIFITVMVLAWIIFMVEGRLSYETPALISLAPLFLLICFNFFGYSALADKAATWTYVFLFLTALGFFCQALGQKTQTIDLKQLLRHLTFEYGVLEVIIKKIPPLIYKLTTLALIVKLLQINTLSISDTFKLYFDYFPKKQFQLFFTGTGWQFLLLYLIVVPVYVQLVKRSKLKLLTTLILLSVTWWGQKLIVDNTTPFRDQVIVLEVKPNNINEPWVDVTVEGRNFNELPFHGDLFVGKQKQRIIKWSDREIIFRTNPTTTKTGGLYVKRSDNKISNSVNFIYGGNR